MQQNNAAPDPLAAVSAVLTQFEPIPLEELGAAMLMDRVDRKFLVAAASLPALLETLSDKYRILDVNGQQLFQYRTRYFDTPELALYHAHHSGRARRYKVRVRNYNHAGPGYLEVKLKNNHGRTQKQRVPLDGAPPMEQLARESLLGFTDTIPASSLHETMLAEFTRITFVRKDAAERITFDFLLTFTRDGKTRAFPEVVVAEIKQVARARSPFLDAMRALHVREGSISKYCAGIASLEPAAKSNRFREFLRRLDSVGHTA